MIDADGHKPLKPSNNPLHGITLLMMLEQLVGHFGWQELGTRIPIRCFNHEPSINSSLRFLRKTEWARAKVEALYVHSRSQFKISASSPEKQLDQEKNVPTEGGDTRG